MIGWLPYKDILITTLPIHNLIIIFSQRWLSESQPIQENDKLGEAFKKKNPSVKVYDFMK